MAIPKPHFWRFDSAAISYVVLSTIGLPGNSYAFVLNVSSSLYNKFLADWRPWRSQLKRQTVSHTNGPLTATVWNSLPSHVPSDVPSRRRFRSASSSQLAIPSFNLSTVGKWAFPVSGANFWNSLLSHVTCVPSLAIFRQRLKTFLFHLSYPDLIL